jgi:hypothetical protein
LRRKSLMELCNRHWSRNRTRSHSFDRLSFGYDRHRGVNKVTAMSKPVVPASLQASLMARLDRLGPAKEMAQIGAAIGREFSIHF